MGNLILNQPLAVSLCEEPCLSDGADVAKFQAAMNLLAGKWKIEILGALINGPRRFGDLKRALPGVTQHVLTAKLRQLADSGLVLRTSYDGENLPHVEYELTEAAYGLAAVFDAMVEWSNRFGNSIR